MSTQQTAVIKTEDKSVEFIPFGAQDKIKLTIAMVKNLVAVKTKSGKTCSDVDAIKFVAMCQARRLNPFEGDAFLIGYDGKDGPSFSLITAHQAFLKRAELNAEYDGMKSGIIVQDGGDMRDLEGDFYTEGQAVVGGWATVFFKNRKQPMHKRIRLKRFQKSWGIWQDDPAGMICKCAEADALRSSFPTMLGGLYLKEEVQTQPDTAKVSAPIFTEPPKAESPVVDVTPEPESPAAEAMREPVDDEPVMVPAKSIAIEGGQNPVKLMRGLIRLAGLKDEQVIHFLKELGSIGPACNTIEQVSVESPDVMVLLQDQHSEIFERIKGGKK